MSNYSDRGQPTDTLVNGGGDPNATEPLPFRYVVGDPCAPVETWAYGFSMYHNPKALVPVPEEVIPDVAHHLLDNQNRIRSAVPQFHPIGSLRHVLNGIDDDTPCPPASPEILQLLDGRPPVAGTVAEAPAGVMRFSRAEFMSHRRVSGPILAPLMEKASFTNEKVLIGTVIL